MHRPRRRRGSGLPNGLPVVPIGLEGCMSTNGTGYTFDRVVRMVLSGAGIVVAVTLAYLLDPLVRVFERKTRRRGLAVAITLGGLGIVGLGVLVLVIPLTL